MTSIYYIGSTAHTVKYKQIASFSNFVKWFKKQKVLSHDIETNKVESIIDRELRTVQFADIKGENIWVIQWSYLTLEQQIELIQLVNDTRSLILIFTKFEYKMWKKYGAILRNLWDVYTVEKVLNAGLTVEKGYYSLAGLYKRRFDMDISKSQQGEFTDDIMTDEKIVYAAIDTLKLGKAYELQILEAEDLDRNLLNYKLRTPSVKVTKPTYHKGIMKTIWWENEFVKVLGDMEYYGVNFSTSQWTDNYYKALPIVEKATIDLNTLVLSSLNNDYLIANNLYTDIDIIVPIWNSSQKKQLVLSWAFSDIEGTSKVALKEYLRDNDPAFPEGLKISGKSWENSDYYRYPPQTKYSILLFLVRRNKENQEEVDTMLNKTFEVNFRDKLVEEGLLTPAGTMLVNWNSPPQKLLIFQQIDSNIENTAAQTVEDNLNTHQMFRVYKKHAEANALITKFGLNYLNNVDVDGRIRTRYDTPLSTGRISSIGPNLLQLPRNQDYRDAFIASPGWKIIGADYSSEEILILAILSMDPVWLKSFKDGDDVHSVNAALIFGQDWVNGAEKDCQFAINKQKCKCKIHKEMRTDSKTISFGVIFGLSAHGLSIQLQITKKKAQVLIDKFFITFPKIKAKLQMFGNFGVTKGYIITSVLGRVRFFDKWKMSLIKKLSYANSGLTFSERYEAEKYKGAFERESKNHPMQGSGADVLKIAGVLLRRFIYNNNYEDRIRLLIPPHDEYMTECEEDIAEMWKEKLQHYMELAGKLALHTDLLKAEAYIADNWVK